MLQARFCIAQHSYIRSFNQQAEAVALEGEEHWPSGQFEPGRGASWSQPT